MASEVSFLICLEMCDVEMVMLVVGTYVSMTAPPVGLMAGRGFLRALLFKIQPAWVGQSSRIIANVDILIECLRIIQVPTERVGRQEPPQRAGVVAGAEVVQPAFLVAGLAGTRD